MQVSLLFRLIESYTCKKKEIFFLVLTCMYSFASAQPSEKSSTRENLIIPSPTKILDESEKRNVPAISIHWENLPKNNGDGWYSFSVHSPKPFSFFGIGWSGEYENNALTNLILKYRTRTRTEQWSEWIETVHEAEYEDSANGLLWSNIIFVNDSVPHNQIEFQLRLSGNEKINVVRIDLVNMKQEHASNLYDEVQFNNLSPEKLQIIGNECPQPFIILRQDWCGNYAECSEPTYIPFVIEPTHVVIHHGASPNTYNDGYSIVRSYWNYHVYSNGWDDIGYNYLIDKYGNIFQGRQNPMLDSQDVKGAHAGNTNGKSIGICFLGNADVTLATDSQLQKLEALLAWWFQTRGFDPTTKSSITNQPGTKMLYLPRIIGHRDVNATSCPGNDLYARLPDIRTATKNRILDCSDTKPYFDSYVSALTVSPGNVKAGEHVQVSFSHFTLGKLLDSTAVISDISFWLSSDSVFNPNNDLFIGEIADTIFQDGKITNLNFGFPVDSGVPTGEYYLFVITDKTNNFYETDETNNESFAPISVTGIQVNIYAESNTLAGGIVYGERIYRYNETCTVSASPNFGYSFVNWTENGIIVSTNQSYRFTATQERNLVANFTCSPESYPFDIIGEKNICSGQDGIVYSVPVIPNAKYLWELPEGASGSSETNSITVSYSDSAKSGNIIVRIENECFQRTEKSLSITMEKTPKPATILLVNDVLRSDSSIGNQWYWNNNIVSGETNQILIPKFTGRYYTVISSSNCNSKPSNVLVFDPTIHEAKDSDPFLYFPNPTKGIIEIFFRVPLNSNSIVEVHNLVGQKIYTLRNLDGSKYTKIDLSHQAQGVYVVSVHINDTVYAVKIIKEN